MKIDLYNYKDNILAWHNLHSVSKTIAINSEQALDVFHDSIDGELKITIVGLNHTKKNNCVEILPKGTQIVHWIYNDSYISLVKLNCGYYVLATWDTDDVLIF